MGERAIAAARATDVEAQALALAEEVLRKEASRQSAEKELQDACHSLDPAQLKAAVTQARKCGASPTKVRVAERAWEKLTGCGEASAALALSGETRIMTMWRLFKWSHA